MTERQAIAGRNGTAGFRRRAGLAALLAIAALLALAWPRSAPIAAADEPAAGAKGKEKAPALSSAGKKELLEIAKKLFSAETDEERMRLLEAARAYDPIPRSAARELAGKVYKIALAGPRLGMGQKQTLASKTSPGDFYLCGARKPGAPGPPQPLLIGLHGGGQGEGDGENALQQWQFAAGKGVLCVFPTVLRKDATAWNKIEEEDYVLELVETVKRTFAVDTNRVYLAGHSMGGYGTWSIGARHADRFAGLSAGAGGIFVTAGGSPVTLERGIVANIFHTPIWFFHSTDDKQVAPDSDQAAARELAKLRTEHPDGYEHVYKEYTANGHNLPPDGLGPILAWLLERRRDPAPAKVVWEPSRPRKRLFYWLYAKEPPALGRVEAAISGQTISVSCEGDGRGLTLFPPPKLLKLDKEVVVTVNGEERFRGRVADSAFAVLASIFEARDPAQVFTAKIDL